MAPGLALAAADALQGGVCLWTTQALWTDVCILSEARTTPAPKFTLQFISRWC